MLIGYDAIMDIKTLRDLIEIAERKYYEIERREWEKNKCMIMSDTEMWKEASQVGPSEWHEVIRVLAQGGPIYSIGWPRPKRNTA